MYPSEFSRMQELSTEIRMDTLGATGCSAWHLCEFQGMPSNPDLNPGTYLDIQVNQRESVQAASETFSILPEGICRTAVRKQEK
jgi:hypothetical protein